MRTGADRQSLQRLKRQAIRGSQRPTCVLWDPCAAPQVREAHRDAQEHGVTGKGFPIGLKCGFATVGLQQMKVQKQKRGLPGNSSLQQRRLGDCITQQPVVLHPNAGLSL